MSKRKTRRPWELAVQAAKLGRRNDRIALYLLLSHYWLWSKPSSADKPDATIISDHLLTATEDLSSTEYKDAFIKACQDFVWRPSQPPPQLPCIQLRSFDNVGYDEVTTSFRDTLDQVRRKLKASSKDCKTVLRAQETAERRKLDKEVDALLNWVVPRKELEAALPPRPKPAPAFPLSVNHGAHVQVTHGSTSAARQLSAPITKMKLTQPPRVIGTLHCCISHIHLFQVNVYFQTSMKDDNFEMDVEQLMRSLSPHSRKWDERTPLMQPAVLFGFVRNLNAVDINDERAADRWAQTGALPFCYHVDPFLRTLHTGRSVIVLCFGPNSRGQLDSFHARPANFCGRPEEMPQLLRTFPSTFTADPFIKCLLCSRPDFARGITTVSWDKTTNGDPSSGLVSYEQMLTKMQLFIEEAASLK